MGNPELARLPRLQARVANYSVRFGSFCLRLESKHYPAYFRVFLFSLFKSKQNDMPMQWLPKVKISKEEAVKIREDWHTDYKRQI